MKLDVKAGSIAAGIVCAIAVAVATIFSLARGGGATLGALTVVFPGYSVSGIGICIAFVYGFIYGAIGGALFTSIYNALTSGKVESSSQE